MCLIESESNETIRCTILRVEIACTNKKCDEISVEIKCENIIRVEINNCDIARVLR